MKSLSLSTMMLLCFFSVHSSAQQLITPTGITSISAATDFFPAINLIDNSGLSSVPTIDDYNSVVHDPTSSTNSWVTVDCAVPCDYYAADLPTPILTLDLGAEYHLTDLVIWNYQLVISGNNIQNASSLVVVEISTTGTAGPWTTIASGLAIPEQNTLAHTISLGGTYIGNAVRLTITDNHYDPASPLFLGGDRVGLSEVKLIGIFSAAIPTMGQWGLIVLGLALFIFGTLVMRKFYLTSSSTTTH